MTHDMEETILNEIETVRTQYQRPTGAHEITMRLLFPHYFGKYSPTHHRESDISLTILRLLQRGDLELTSRYFLKPKGEPSYE